MVCCVLPQRNGRALVCAYVCLLVCVCVMPTLFAILTYRPLFTADRCESVTTLQYLH